MKPHSLSLHVTAARVFFRFLYLREYIPSDLAQHFASPCRFKADRRPKYLPWAKIQKALATVDRRHPKGIRDYAVLTLLIYHGLRPREVAQLALADIDFDNSSFLVRERKNGTSTRLPLSSTAKEAIQQYLAVRPATSIPNVFLGHRAPLRPLATSAIGSFTPRYLRQCFGGSLRCYGPYLFRHSFAKALLDRGATLPQVGALLGHRCIDSTLIYTRIHTQQLREVADNYANLL
jgi:site-specific recombinase XerD